MYTSAQSLKVRLRADLLAARKAGQTDEVAVLRSLLAAIDNAEAPPIGSQAASGAVEIDRLMLSDDELTGVLLRDIEERETASEELAGVGQPERADVLLRQAEMVRRYLG